MKAQDSGVVGAHLTPAEIEDRKINDIYQPVYQLLREGNRKEIVRISETEVIPRAEKSQFPETRNKFLYLANRNIADCHMGARQYREAAEKYEKRSRMFQLGPEKGIQIIRCSLDRSAPRRSCRSTGRRTRIAGKVGDDIRDTDRQSEEVGPGLREK